MKEGIPVPPPEESLPEKDLVTREQEALLALGRLRQDPNATEDQIKEAESKFIALKREREKEDGTDNLPPPEDDGVWEHDEPVVVKPIRRSVAVEETLPEEEVTPLELAKNASIFDERKAEFAKSIDAMSPEELQEHIEYLDSQNRLARETDDDLLKDVVDKRLNAAVSQLRKIDSPENAAAKYEEYKARQGEWKGKLDTYTEKAQRDSKIGSKVNWESQGALQFPEPTTITGFSDDGKFAFVEGTSTGIPIEQLVPVELRKEAEEVKAEIEKMPEEEKRSLGENLRWLGFRFEEKKNKVLSGFMEKAMDGLSLKEKSHVGRFVTAAKNSFDKNAESVRQKEKALKDKENQKVIYNYGYLAGNVIKYGRILYDLTKRSVGSPIRGIMLAGTAVRSLAEIGEQAHFLDDEAKEKTRIADVEKAWELADELYKKAEAKAPEGKVTAEALKDVYRRELPDDLKKRLGDPSFANGFVQKMIGEDIKWSLDRLSGAIADAKSEEEINSLLKKWDADLKSYDLIIGNYGTVDGWAMTFKYLSSIGKGMVWGASVATLEIGVDKLIENISETLADTEVVDANEVLPNQFDNTVPKGSVVQDYTPKEPVLGKIAGAQELSKVVPDVSSGEELKGLEGGNIEATLDEKGVETIQKGGNVSKSIHDMLAKGEITKKEFMEAWRNPESVVDVAGEKVHVSEMGLVHEGNQVKFVAGEAGKAGRFEVVQGAGKEYGSNKDLLARYNELGKKAPEWLQPDAVEGAPAAEAPVEINKTTPETGWHPEWKLRESIGEALTQAAVDNEAPKLSPEALAITEQVKKMSDQEILAKFLDSKKYSDIIGKNPTVKDVYNWIADASVTDERKIFMSRVLGNHGVGVTDYFGKPPSTKELNMKFIDFLRDRYLEESIDQSKMPEWMGIEAKSPIAGVESLANTVEESFKTKIDLNYADPSSTTMIKGPVELDYDSKTKMIRINSRAAIVGLRGDEYFSESALKGAESYVRDGLKLQGKDVITQMKVYEQIKDRPEYKNESQMLLKYLKAEVQNTLIGNKRVFDPNKLPDYLRP